MSQRSTMASGLGALLAGALFGLGLSVAGMTNPQKVLNFLDIAGTWDPSLLLVLGSAVGVFAIAYRFILRAPGPLLAPRFHWPTLTRVDRPLVVGSIVFGLGWGLAGYCPGPAVSSLGFANPEALWIVPSMVLGVWLQKHFAATAADAPPGVEADAADA